MPIPANAQTNTKPTGKKLYVINKLRAGLTITHPDRTEGATKDGDPPHQTVNLNGAMDEVISRGLEPSGNHGDMFFGVTEVDADWWASWAKEHKDFPALKNGLIEAFDSEAKAKDAARERVKEKTGMEGLDMPKDENDKKPVDARLGKSDQVDFKADNSKE